jgi:hypothetical protein
MGDRHLAGLRTFQQTRGPFTRADVVDLRGLALALQSFAGGRQA